MRSMIVAYVGVATCLFVACVALGGERSAARALSDEPFTISDNVNMVVLDVAVKDKAGNPVLALGKSDFQVFDDGRPMQIAQFASVDAPVTLGLVVDNSGSMLRKRPEVILAGLAFARQSNPQDEFFVVNFNNSIVRGLPAQTPFTDNLQALRSALYLGNPMGQTALYDAIAYSLRHLELGHREKRTLIVVSDGGDNVSRVRLPELLRLIESSRTTIYTVGLYDRENDDLNPSVLRRIAALSGGEFFEPTAGEVLGVLEKISKDIRTRYTIAYVPEERDNGRVVHKLRVTARQGQLKYHVLSRTTYSMANSGELVAQRPEAGQGR